MSGQVWYDQIGLNPDDRAKIYADKNRPLTLEEQKQNIEAEREKRKFDEAIYKSRAGDVATWITDIERQKKLYSNDQNAAHLGVTNVTRDKINFESVRRYNVNETNKSSKQYHDDLAKQVEELNRENKLKKLKDDVAGIEHTRKWDDWVSAFRIIMPIKCIITSFFINFLLKSGENQVVVRHAAQTVASI